VIPIKKTNTIVYQNLEAGAREDDSCPPAGKMVDMSLQDRINQELGKKRLTHRAKAYSFVINNTGNQNQQQDFLTGNSKKNLKAMFKNEVSSSKCGSMKMQRSGNSSGDIYNNESIYYNGKGHGNHGIGLKGKANSSDFNNGDDGLGLVGGKPTREVGGDKRR
jgi:hypothetical protein